MPRWPKDWLLVPCAAALLALFACSADDESAKPGNGGSGAAGTSGNAGQTAGGSGGGSAGLDAGGDSAIAGSGGDAGPPGALALVALAANTTVGLEWNAIAGADSYNVYWSTTAGVTPQNGQKLTAPKPNIVHRSLTNGTAYHYVVTAVLAGVETPSSVQVSATPSGEWVLEEFGNGIVEDVRTKTAAARVPLDKRLNVLLFAEGYLTADLAVLHSMASHDGNRANDVDRWVDLVFGIEPYKAYREAFLVWYLPRASTTPIGGGNTAFQVPLDTAATSPGVGQVAADGETARLAWQAIAGFPFAPTDFGGPNSGTARSVIASFMMFDPARRRAGVSGRATSLRNPNDTSQRVSAAFGVGHAHEFTHAFSSLRDEYLEDGNSAPSGASSTSNVVGTNVCSQLPWSHLLQGGAFNPSQGNLVGAFGRPQHGYHSELRCLLNGTHDNATYYGGNGLLRVEDRMCNFCREMTAFRIHQRSGVVPAGQPGFDAWARDLRPAFFQRFGFATPSPVPQTNSAGMPFFEACSAASSAEEPLTRATTAPSEPRQAGCVLDPL